MFNKILILEGIGKEHFIEQEKWMKLILKAQLSNIEDKVFIDVGVNTGQTLIKYKEINENGEYIGFEPNVSCNNYVNRLVELNNVKNVTIIPAAVSNTSDHIKLFSDNNSVTDSSASMLKSVREGLNNTKNIVCLDPNSISLLKDKNIGLIKIDVEGAELEVLEGFKEIIIKQKPKIIIEILPVYTTDNIERLNRQRKILNLLEELNYIIYRIDIKNISLNRIKDFGIHSNIELCNYLLTPHKID